MCDPVSLTAAGLAVGLAGSGASFVAQQQQQSAAKDAQQQYDQQSAAATNAATAKQEQIDQSKQATMNQTYNNYGQQAQQAQQSAIQNDLGNLYGQSVTNLAPSSVPGIQNLTQNPQSAGQLAITNNYQGNSDTLSAYLKQQAQAKAALDSFGNQNINNNLYNVRQGQQLSNQNNFASGNSQTQQIAQQAANQTYQGNLENAQNSSGGLDALGGALGGIGSAVGKLSTLGATPGYQPIPKATAASGV